MSVLLLVVILVLPLAANSDTCNHDYRPLSQKVVERIPYNGVRHKKLTYPLYQCIKCQAYNTVVGLCYPANVTVEYEAHNMQIIGIYNQERERISDAASHLLHTWYNEHCPLCGVTYYGQSECGDTRESHSWVSNGKRGFEHAYSYDNTYHYLRVLQPVKCSLCGMTDDNHYEYLGKEKHKFNGYHYQVEGNSWVCYKKCTVCGCIGGKR